MKEIENLPLKYIFSMVIKTKVVIGTTTLNVIRLLNCA